MAKNNGILIVIVFLIIVFAGWQLGLFSTYQPTTEKLTQYVINTLDQGFYDHFEGSFLYYTSNPGQINTNPLLNTNLSKIATINSGKHNFKFVSTYQPKLYWVNKYGLDLDAYPGISCGTEIEVYRDGQLIDTLTDFQYSYNDGPAGQDTLQSIPILTTNYYDNEMMDSYVTIIPKFVAGSNPSVPCAWMVNQYMVTLSNESFNFNFSLDTTTFIENEPINVNTKITNNMNQVYQADIDVKFVAPTLFGSVEKIISQSNVILNPGENNVVLTLIPTTTTGKLEITPTLVLKEPGTGFTGLNYGPSDTEYVRRYENGAGATAYWVWKSSAKKIIKSTDFTPIGVIKWDTFLVSVSPAPLYLPVINGICEEGYELSGNGEYCIRDDITQLGCFILGCPSIPGHDYYCTSSGMCAETIFVDRLCENDSMCPSDTVCDINTGLCIRTEIVNEVIQCQENSDCPGSPCAGISYYCNSNNLCSKQGEACITQPPQRTLWDMLVDLWEGFVQWLNSVF